MIRKYAKTMYVDQDGVVWTNKELNGFTYKRLNTKKERRFINEGIEEIQTIVEIKILAKQLQLWTN